MIAREITLQEKLDMVIRNLPIHNNEDTFYMHVFDSANPEINSKEIHTKLELLKRLDRLMNDGDDRFNSIEVFKVSETRDLHEHDIEGGSTLLSTICNVATGCQHFLNELTRPVVVTNEKAGFVDFITTAQNIWGATLDSPIGKKILKFPTTGKQSQGNLAFEDSVKVYKVLGKQLF